MQTYLILATGTDIGKTFLTETYIRNAHASGKKVSALKPVQTGWNPNDPNIDTRVLTRALGWPEEEQYWNAISPLRFAAPLTPSMAAAAEGKIITKEQVVAHCKAWQQECEKQQYNLGYIETAGGIMSPLTDTHTMLDLAEALKLPVILVAGTYLGALSHTLTAYHVLKSKGLILEKLVLNESESSIGLEATHAALTHHIKEPIDELRR